MANNSKNGKKYEEAVAEIHKLFSEDTEILTNQYIEDNFGIKREFDIVIKTKACNYDVMGLVECKNHNRKVDIPVVEAFAKKSESVNANFKIIFSKKGFSKNAVKLAEKYGIKPYSLVDNENKELSLKVGWLLYGKTYKFGFVSGKIDTVKDLNLQNPLQHNEPFFRKRNLYELSIKEIVKASTDSEIPVGRYEVEATVDNSSKRFVTIRGKRYAFKNFTYTVQVDCELRKRKLPFEAKGIFNWQTKKLELPDQKNNLISVGEFRLDDMQDWDTCKAIPDDDVFRLVATNYPYPVDAYPEHLGLIGNVKIRKIN